jgi:hypothetical protein
LSWAICLMKWHGWIDGLDQFHNVFINKVLCWWWNGRSVLSQYWNLML